MNYVMPSKESLDSVLSMLFGEEAAVESVSDQIKQKYCAGFVDSESRTVACCSADIEFASFAGAAFSMVPADVAQEFVADDALSGPVESNLHEIMNIFSSLLMTDNTPHLKLHEVQQSSELAYECEAPQNFAITVPGYGTGKVSFHVS